MFRSSLIVAGAALLCSSAIAQQSLPASRLRPITAPVKDAGTVDVTTGKWTRPGQVGNHQKAAVIKTIFNNTCTWITQGYYAGFSPCDDNYDEGRVPSPSDPNAPGTANATNLMDSFQVSYCTFIGPAVPSGGYDMDVAFYDNLNGDCVGFAPPTPPHASVTATAYFALAGLGLPGSTALGFQACWLVTLDVSNTGWVMASDGNGTFDNDPSVDKFNWLQRQNNALSITAANPDGFIISGEPATGGFGACSYNIACGTDAVFGGTCGTGLDAFDASWINVDSVGAGSSVTIPPTTQACPYSVAQYGFGTNCYFFGGYPTNPFASYWLVLKSERVGATTYCTQTKATTVAGCIGQLSATGPLLTDQWLMTNIPLGPAAGGSTIGIFIYTQGVGIGQSAFSANINFGTLCLQPGQFLRTAPTCAPVVISGGGTNVCHPGFPPFTPSCNAPGLSLSVGEDVNVQGWYRDPGSVGNANFTNAIFYTIQ